MTWADYYDRFDGWQESTQYSRLASISNFGPEGSPSAEIADCIQYVEPRTATSIVRRALAAGVRFRAAEITDIVDSGQIEDDDLLGKLIRAYSDNYTGKQLETLLFFASPFWKKLQSKNGKSCRTKMAKVAKLLYLTALLPECCLLCRYTWFNASRRAVYVGVGPTAMLPHPDLCFCFPFSHPSS